MSTSSFRRALRRLADAAGPGDADRLTNVRARAHRTVVRRRAGAAGVVAFAAVLGVLVATLPGTNGRDSLVATTPTPSESGSPSDTPSASPSATPTATTPTATPTPSPSTTVVVGPPSPAPSYPQVTLAMVAAPTGGETIFEAHVVDPHGSVAGLQFSYGLDDPAHPSETIRWFPGAGDMNYIGDVDRTEMHCAESLAAPVDRRIRFTRTFRVPGTYTAWVRVQTRSCVGFAHDGGTWHLRGAHVGEDSLRYTVTGRLWPNGPAQPVPTLTFRHTHWSPPDEVDDGPGVQVKAYDDGDFRTVRVDWGDGNAEDVAFGSISGQDGGFNDCAHPQEFRNAQQYVVARPDHTYATAGTYTVTVTVTTASCDGTDVQSATTSGSWDWPGPSASPT